MARQGMWPTPKGSAANYGRPRHNDRGDLQAAVTNWPTPTARLGDQRGPQAKRYFDPARSNDLDDAVAAMGTPGQLNPTWVEWLMGYPLGWTDSGD
jgi:DNA (cytosine-5)-methyltransferase 1